MNNVSNPFPENCTMFLHENEIATVCFVDENTKPYCINCFYAFNELNHCLIFKSSKGTNHQGMCVAGKSIAGTILPLTINIFKLKGIQFVGEIMNESEIESFKLKSKYLQKNPLSLAMPGYIWAIKLTFIKYTDTTLRNENKTTWTL